MASFDPIKVPLSLAGLAYEWILSRPWLKILTQIVPLLILVTLMITVWFVSYQDTNKLAEKYLALSAPGVAEWEQRLFEKLSATPAQASSTSGGNPSGDPSQSQGTAPTSPGDETGSDDDGSDNGVTSTDPTDIGDEKKESYQVPSYEEMLCRRVELLKSNPQSRFVVGTAQLLKGAAPNSRKILRKIAPDDKEGVPKAHAVMALGYFNEFLATKDPSLIPLLQHHADIAVQWASTPKDILMVAADLSWQRGKTDRALEIIESAAERFPELYPVLLERANLLNKQELAESARSKAIIHFQKELDADPKNEVTRIQLTQLLGSSDEALDQIEKLIDEGLQIEQSARMVRAKSEVHRIRFMKQLIEKQGKIEDFSELNQALELDKTNPMVAEQVARLVRDGIRPPRELQEQLRDLLSNGQASILTHAIMSEYYLAANRRSEAIMHLEKVFAATPTDVKYANNLAYLYAKEGRLEDAQQTARKCLELLQRTNTQNQRFVDELLDTLGFIYEEQKKVSDAISSYELSLRYNPERIDTREKLAAIYRTMGNTEVAKAHERAIESIKKAQEEKLKQAREATPQQAANGQAANGQASESDTSEPTDSRPQPESAQTEESAQPEQGSQDPSNNETPSPE